MNSARTLLSVAAAVLVVGLAGFRNGEALARPSMEPEKSKAPIRKATIADAAFISGSWSVTTEKRFTQEVWTAAKAGRMTGMFRWIKADGSPLLYELLTIAEKGGGLEMRLAHFDADLSPLPGLKETIALVASELEPGRIVFTPIENGKELKRIVYSGSTGSLRVEVEYVAEGRSPSIFVLARDEK